MKKAYLKPSMGIEFFEVMDVMSVSGTADFDASGFFGEDGGLL